MKYVHPFRTGRHKRQADITLLFQYMYSNVNTEGHSYIGKFRKSKVPNKGPFLSMDGHTMDDRRKPITIVHLEPSAQVS